MNQQTVMTLLLLAGGFILYQQIRKKQQREGFLLGLSGESLRIAQIKGLVV